jgi:hypothetical protein
MANYSKGIFIKRGKYSLKCSVKTSDFVQWLNENTNDKGYCNIEIKERKEPGKYGDTHYAVKDEWQPEKKEEMIPGNTLDEQIEASKHLPKGEKKYIPAMSKESDLPVDNSLPF